MGNIQTGQLFFMRLENAFLLSQNGDIIEVISEYDNLENDLIACCRFKGELFLKKIPLHNKNDSNFAYIMQKESPTKFATFDPNSLLSPPHQGLAPKGVSIELASPQYHFPLNNKMKFMRAIWSSSMKKQKKHNGMPQLILIGVKFQHLNQN